MDEAGKKSVENRVAESRHRILLRVTGRVEKPLTLTREELEQMDQVEASEVAMICGSGEPLGIIEHCRGILFSDIVNRAEVRIEGHFDTRRMYLIAMADDGYKVVFSWQELFNSPVGEGILVLLARQGDKQQGDGLELLSLRDFLTGPRHVRGLARIEIAMVE